MFELKKVIGGLLMPLPFALIVICFLLLFISKKNIKSYTLCMLSVLSLWFVSTPHFAGYLITPKERAIKQFEHTRHKYVDYIVVLGGGLSPNTKLHPNLQLSNPSVTRLVEGMRLAHIYSNATLIVSGAGHTPTNTTSHLMSQTAQSLGIKASRIHLNAKARDTESEAKDLAPMLVDSTVALVTSASHMRRAQDLFAAQGVDTIAAPVEFYSYDATPIYKRFIASSTALSSVTSYCHEWLGQQWISLRRALDSGSV
ncbi:YdcF family protein [Pseudoalteromonas sp. SMS1]|uniref:ElyC/SanA/YdcF family protein n=1 Tax=Pseudoalteromonas sp. SMS1 TaxID=2908894 RepID=UPI001F180CB9|nr:ElyC/SanA/YdcF family protein [Pseudoalteromonas sp. SMS1]MCF2860338.1 YdcF family protein [Pseudoalteromonas sp. SMS1]